MAPVDMALMESGSDNQSEQPSNIRMSRVVPAALVLLGLVGTAFMLGRGSVTSLAAPTEAVGLTIGSPGIPDIGDQFSKSTVGKKESEMVGICNEFKALPLYQNLADQAWLACRPRCQSRIPEKFTNTEGVTPALMVELSKPVNCPVAVGAGMTAAGQAVAAVGTPVFLANYQAKTTGLCDAGIQLVCAEFKRICPAAADLAIINQRPRCR